MSSGPYKRNRIAIIHDWLTAPGGAERVLRQMLRTFPDADLFTVCDFLPEEHRHLLEGRVPRTSFIQNLPFARTHYRMYLPLMPAAVEQFDLSAYDIILSSSYCVAKGVLTGPDQIHVSYVHTPVRYAWHLQHQYLAEMGLSRGVRSLLVRAILHYIRLWDIRSSVNVDRIVTNSRYVARQVSRLYQKECAVLPPPVELDRFTLQLNKEDYFVTASRMVPYKRVDLIVKAFARMPARKLVVIGDGPDMVRVRAAAAGHSNISIVGYRTDEDLQALVSKARAFVFAAIEDFGISVVEAQAAGTPVIALGRGGVLETVQGLDSQEPTGVHFHEQTEESLIEAVEEFDREWSRIKATACRRNAERFSSERFCCGLIQLVEETLVKRLEPEIVSNVLVLPPTPIAFVQPERERAAG